MQFTKALTGYWLENERNFSPNTVTDYSLTFRRFAAYINDKPVAQITTADVRHFLNTHVPQAYPQVGDKTRCNMWVALSSFWSWAATEFQIPHIIRGHIDQPKYTRKQIRAYTETDVKAMLAACDHAAGWTTKYGQSAKTAKRPTALRDKAIIAVLTDCGLRASELANLDMRDYHERDGRLMVRHGKGDKERVVFLGQNAKRHLWRYLASRGDLHPTDALFATRTGKKLGRAELLHMIKRTARRAGLPNDVTVHMFRHTSAINFIRNGASPLEVQAVLGHEKLDTVRIYVRLAEVDLQNTQRRASPADHWRL